MSTEVNDARQQAIYKLEGIKEMMGKQEQLKQYLTPRLDRILWLPQTPQNGGSFQQT